MNNSDLFGSKKINTTKSLLKNQAYELLKAAIIDGSIAPATIYSQESLSKSLGISRTPVREALLQLQSEGVIRIHRGRGIEVVTTTIYDLKDILELNAALESKIAQLATERITASILSLLESAYEEQAQAAQQKEINLFMVKDHEFHLILAKATGNKRLVENIELIHDQLLRGGVICEVDNLIQIANEHNKVLDCLKKRCTESTVKAMNEHLNNNFIRAMTYIEQTSSETD